MENVQGAEQSEDCIHSAARSGDLNSVKRFLTEGFHIDSLGVHGRKTALFEAVNSSRTNVALYLLDHGARIDACSSCQPLTSSAVGKGLVEVVHNLVERRGLPVLSKDDSGYTLLHVSCLVNEPAMTKYLLRRSQTIINDETNTGHSALNFAAHRGNANIIEILLQHGADVNTMDGRGWTPLHHVVNRSRKQLLEHQTQDMRVLLQGGCDRRLTTVDGDTPLHVVRCVSDAQLLVEHDYNMLCEDPLFDPIDIKDFLASRNRLGKTALESVKEQMLLCRGCSLREGHTTQVIEYLESWASYRLAVPEDSASERAHFEQGTKINPRLVGLQRFLTRRQFNVIDRSKLSEVSLVIMGYLTPLDLVNTWWEKDHNTSNLEFFASDTPLGEA